MASPDIRSPLRTTNCAFSSDMIDLMTPFVMISSAASSWSGKYSDCHICNEKETYFQQNANPQRQRPEKFHSR